MTVLSDVTMTIHGDREKLRRSEAGASCAAANLSSTKVRQGVQCRDVRDRVELKKAKIFYASSPAAVW